MVDEPNCDSHENSIKKEKKKKKKKKERTEGNAPMEKPRNEGNAPSLKLVAF